MALVSHVLGNCPGCRRKDSFENVDVFRGDHVYQGCKACSFSRRVPLPKLKKRVIYLDQFFFSHALRGQDPRFLRSGLQFGVSAQSDCRRVDESPPIARYVGCLPDHSEFCHPLVA